MAESIFSTYSTGENRVTGSILAVLRSLALGRTERLLGALLQESEFQLLHFQNQPARGGESIPDAQITGSCRVLIETKVVRNGVSEDQVLQHLKRLNGREKLERLLVLTPDERRPKPLATVTEECYVLLKTTTYRCTRYLRFQMTKLTFFVAFGRYCQVLRRKIRRAHP